MADNNPFDQATRYVARMDPPGMIAWALSCSTNEFRFVRWLDTRSVPFPGASDRISDLVAQLERNEPPGQPWLIPIEFQVGPDPLMFGRLLEYLGRLWRAERPSAERGDRFWLGAAVVNLTGSGCATVDCEWSQAGPRVLLRVSERNVSQESAEQTLADIANGLQSPVLLTFVPLMEGGAEPGIIVEWKRLALVEPESRRRSDLGALAIVLAEASGRKEIWNEALGGWNMRQSQQVLEWQAEARAEGLAEGKAEGRMEGQAIAVIAVLEARFQSVSAGLVESIRSISDLQRLSALLPLAAKAASLDQFRLDAGL